MQRLGRVKLLPEKAVRNSNAGYAVEAGELRGQGRVKQLIFELQVSRLICDLYRCTRTGGIRDRV